MKKLALLGAVVLDLSGIASAVTINVDVNDRPYYIHGGLLGWLSLLRLGAWSLGLVSSSPRLDSRPLRRALIEQTTL